MKILITGGSGFLGSALALHWQASGHQIALLARQMSDLSRFKDRLNDFNIYRYTNDADIRTSIHDFKPDLLVHTACSYGRKNESHTQLFDVNFRLGIVLIDILHELNLKVTMINTGTVLQANTSVYAFAKNQLSEWGLHLAKTTEHPFQFINVLLQHMYGPNDDDSKFPTYVLNACQNNQKLLRLTMGEQERDFIYIDDVVSAYDAIMLHRDEMEKSVSIELGSGLAPTIRQFVETVHRITASNTQLEFGAIPYRANESMRCIANLETIKKTGWFPKFNIEEGIEKMIEMSKIK